MLSISDVAGDVRLDLAQRRYLYWCTSFAPAEALSREAARAQPALVLLPRYAVAPFAGRNVEIEQFLQWLPTPSPLAVWMIHADGGHGKTRLADHFHRIAVTQGWATQQAVPAVDGTDSTAVIDTSGQGLLLVIDDAHRWQPAALDALMVNVQALTGDQPELRIRLLILARTTAPWWPTLATTLRNAGVPETATALAPLRLDRTQIFDDAFTAFRDALHPPPPPQVRRRDPAEYRALLNLSGPRYGSVLAIHMAALETAHARRPIDTPAPYALSVYLLDSEVTEWTKRHSAGLNTPPHVLQRLVLLATLTRGLPRDRARELLITTGLATTDNTADTLLDDHARCYLNHAHVLTPLQPDALGEDFIALTTPGRPNLSSNLPVDDWGPAAIRRALSHRPDEPPSDWAVAILATLIETAARWPHITTNVINPILGADPLLALAADPATLIRLAQLSDITTATLSTLYQHLIGHPAQPALETALLPERIANTTDSAEQADLYLRYSHYLHHGNRRQAAVAPAQHAVRLFRVLAEADPILHQPHLAGALGTFAVRLDQAGHWRDAVEPAREAVTIYQNLIKAGIGTHRTELAGALNNLANSLSQAGFRREAVEPAREAAILFRALAETDPIRHQPHLAGALNNLANWLSRAGFRREAVEPAREAAILYRALTEVDPTTYQPDLANALATLANLLGQAGFRREAVEPAREAAILYRALTEVDPTTYQPDLARALNNLANWLGEAGHWREAVEPAGEAAILFRALAEVDPTTYQPGLASALDTLAIRLGNAGYQREAVEPARQATTLYRVLAETDPTTYQPSLARTLVSLAIRLGEAGLEREAIEPARQAVAIFRALDEADSTTYQPDLAHALGNLAIRLGEAGHRREAITPAEHAVRLFRALTEADPVRHQFNLASTLRVLAVELGEAGHWQEAVEPAHQAVTIFRALAEADPAAHQLHLAQSLSILAAVSEGGAASQVSDGLAAASEAVHLLEHINRQHLLADPGLLAQARIRRARLLARLMSPTTDST
ncbi:tetratricopeptide repeat protein [Nocardia jiangsuensis]|uniref:Tetratricopeptide repeat protein n=1 Tax=Nocardia jiangsuensis TaxID=1691563 RepID=A0ABV8DXS0_9NOCA